MCLWPFAAPSRVKETNGTTKDQKRKHTSNQQMDITRRMLYFYFFDAIKVENSLGTARSWGTWCANTVFRHTTSTMYTTDCHKRDAAHLSGRKAQSLRSPSTYLTSLTTKHAHWQAAINRIRRNYPSRCKGSQKNPWYHCRQYRIIELVAHQAGCNPRIKIPFDT